MADHPITVTPSPGRLRVVWRGRVVADSARALILREASHPPVCYVPREDAEMRLFQRTERKTHCPHKGDANYFTLVDGDARDENAVWTYERPFAPVAAIAGHLAFYPDRVEFKDQ